MQSTHIQGIPLLNLDSKDHLRIQKNTLIHWDAAVKHKAFKRPLKENKVEQ